jgi:hypothetical protein
VIRLGDFVRRAVSSLTHERGEGGCRCAFCRASRSNLAWATIRAFQRGRWWRRGEPRAQHKGGSQDSALHEVRKRADHETRRRARKQHPRNAQRPDAPEED